MNDTVIAYDGGVFFLLMLILCFIYGYGLYGTPERVQKGKPRLFISTDSFFYGGVATLVIGFIIVFVIFLTK